PPRHRLLLGSFVLRYLLKYRNFIFLGSKNFTKFIVFWGYFYLRMGIKILGMNRIPLYRG
ncbi:MAG: hypothetical protein AAB721_03060, partial [Patescibacteria group bacterium]